MSLTLGKYIGRMLLMRVVGATLILAALLQVLDLLDAATGILERGDGIVGILRHVALRLPSIVDQVIPIGVLAGSVITFGALARSNEIVILRSAGITLYRLLAICLPVVLLMGALQFVLADQVAPPAERRLYLVEQADKPTSPDDPDEKPVWVRLGRELVQIDRMRSKGTELQGLLLYRRDNDGMLQSWATASHATWANNGWQLFDVVETKAAEPVVASAAVAVRPWQVNLTPEQVIGLFVPNERVSTSMARSVLAGQRPGAKAPAFYETQLRRAFVRPFAAVIMLLLAIPAAASNHRSVNAGQSTLLALALGLVFVLADGVINAFGEAGVLPPLLAAWGATLLFAAIGGSLLLRIEDR